MNEDFYFSRSSVIEVDAAVAGIGKNRWEYAGEDWTSEQALEFMAVNRFDVLPIKSDKGVREFFQTKRWNDFSELPERKRISHRDVIAFRTPIRDVMQAFAREDRFVYFLASGLSIVGFISVANLNSRHVKTYLFSLVSQLEIRLSHLIYDFVSEEALFEQFFVDSSQAKHKGLRKIFERDKQAGFDVHIVEYLYLDDLIEASKKHGLTRGFSGVIFTEGYKFIKDLRDSIAHPTKTSVGSKLSPKALWECIDAVEEALFQLEHMT